MRQLKTIDPAQAGKVVQLLPPGETQTHAALDIARAMADQKPASAMEWVAALPSAELRQLALHNVLDVWLAAAPAAASAFVVDMPVVATTGLKGHVANRDPFTR